MLSTKGKRFYLTYEELKLGSDCNNSSTVTWFYLTYEELKLGQAVTRSAFYHDFILPMRNWNEAKESTAVSNEAGFYLTYEELKHDLGVERDTSYSVILSYLWGIETPGKVSNAFTAFLDFILPMRNWNIWTTGALVPFVRILSYLWGIETW